MRKRFTALIVSAVLGVTLATGSPSSALAAGESPAVLVGAAAASTALNGAQPGSTINATCYTAGWPEAYMVTCSTYSSSIYYAWIYCTALSSSVRSYRDQSPPRTTCCWRTGGWTEVLTCGSNHYMSNAGWVVV
jgi:hypothetical protein